MVSQAVQDHCWGCWSTSIILLRLQIPECSAGILDHCLDLDLVASTQVLLLDILPNSPLVLSHSLHHPHSLLKGQLCHLVACTSLNARVYTCSCCALVLWVCKEVLECSVNNCAVCEEAGEPRREPSVTPLTWPFNLQAAGCEAAVLTTATPRHPKQKIVFALLLLYFLFLSPSLPHRPKTLVSTHEAASLLNIYFSFFSLWKERECFLI